MGKAVLPYAYLPGTAITDISRAEISYTIFQLGFAFNGWLGEEGDDNMV